MMYIERRRQDAVAVGLVYKMVEDRQDRFDNAKILYGLGFDVRDALNALALNNVPTIFCTTEDDQEENKFAEQKDTNLTVAYWANAVLGCISRAYAIKLWTGLKINIGTSFVDSFSAISCFLGRSPLEV